MKPIVLRFNASHQTLQVTKKGCVYRLCEWTVLRGSNVMMEYFKNTWNTSQIIDDDRFKSTLSHQR
jgi:hypothetical protein